MRKPLSHFRQYLLLIIAVVGSVLVFGIERFGGEIGFFWRSAIFLVVLVVVFSPIIVSRLRGRTGDEPRANSDATSPDNADWMIWAMLRGVAYFGIPFAVSKLFVSHGAAVIDLPGSTLAIQVVGGIFVGALMGIVAPVFSQSRPKTFE